MSRLRYIISINKVDILLSEQIADREIDKITNYIHPGEIICLVGGGGKTSTMLQLAKEIASEEKNGNPSQVIMTTTTHIKPFEEALPDGVQCIGQFCKANGKLGPVEDPESLKDHCDYLLIEADGSRGLPVKVPASHEPVIIEPCDLVIAVMGLSGIGKPIKEVCHRIPLVCQLLDKKETDLFTEEDAVKILLSENGLKKEVGDRRYAVILNQADDEGHIQIGNRIQSRLPEDFPCLMTAYEV